MSLNCRKARQYQALVDEYSQTLDVWQYSAAEVAAWIIDGDRIEINRDSLVEMVRKELVIAMRQDVVEDDNGRRVRQRHCYRYKPSRRASRSIEMVNRVLWFHVDRALDDWMIASFKDRRRQIRGDVEQLRADVDAFNERRALRGLPPFPLSWDFTVRTV